jgi:hypothetical protein
MDNAKSSFWGSVSYIGQTGTGAVKIAIAGREVVVRDSDPGLLHVHVSGGTKPTFLVLDQVMSGLFRIRAVYNHPKADRKLALSIQTDLAKERATTQYLKDWDPDYLLEE